MDRLPAHFAIELPAWLARVEPPAGEDDAARMGFVIGLARRNMETASGGPFAAAVFAGGRLLAVGANLVVASRCSAAHAEVVALSLAQQAIGDYDLGGGGRPPATLYTSCEPCAMCLGAVLWSGVRRLVCAATEADARAAGFDEGPKHPDWTGELARRGIEVVTGCCRAEAAVILAAYRAGGGRLYNARAGAV
jgi:tRNA(Arg) A34 adenosine deaminase TadA